MNKLLTVKSLRTALHAGAVIVDDISFSITAGETFALLGESGCGKSMTALSLMRLLPDGIGIAQGDVQLDGQDILALPEREMRSIRGGQMAMIFQEPGLSLNPVMTVGAQIAESLALHQNLHGEAALARAAELLEQVGLSDAQRRLRAYPFQLSGGMKQRVMIAMALAGQPKLLIADEPTTALDVTIQAQVLQLLRDTQQKNQMAMLLITHDLGVVAQMAHQVAVMYVGQMIEQASRAQLFAHPAHPYTQKLFAALPRAESSNMDGAAQPLAAIPGNVPALGAARVGCLFAPRCDQAWARCHAEMPGWTTLPNGQGVRCHLYSADMDTLGRGEGEREKGEGGRVGAALGLSFKPIIHSQALLQVEDLRVHFPIHKGILQRTVGHVKAVDGLSLNISAGRTVALVGESGCGKTTVGKAILQLVPPTAGRVRFAGNDLIGLGAQQLRARELRANRAGMQMIFQDPYASLNPKMRVAEVLQEGMDALEIGANSVTRQQRINELLDQVGLAQASKWRYPHEFSGGQRQRIAIARALAVNPSLLICDEPTSALDVSVQAQILNLLKTLQQELGLSYLFISHNLAVVEYLAHEVCVMYLGRIVERGTVSEVMRSPRHPYTQALLAAVPHINGQEVEESQAKNQLEKIALAGEMPSAINPPQGCHFHPRCPRAMEICRVNYPEATQVSDSRQVNCYLETNSNS